MTVFKCKCGKIVAYGEITRRDNKLKCDLKSVYPKQQGTMIKNGSNNPRDWIWLCSKCQATKVAK